MSVAETRELEQNVPLPTKHQRGGIASKTSQPFYIPGRTWKNFSKWLDVKQLSNALQALRTQVGYHELMAFKNSPSNLNKSYWWPLKFDFLHHYNTYRKLVIISSSPWNTYRLYGICGCPGAAIEMRETPGTSGRLGMSDKCRAANSHGFAVWHTYFNHFSRHTLYISR